MAELTPIPAAQRPAEPGYQPLSGYAVAAVIVGAAFAIALLVLVGMGLWSRRTPLSYELLAVPIAGVVLAVVARSHIRNSEGTRTGTRLANAAWWVCVLGGAGFAAFLAANDVALTRESQRTADAFFESLKAGRDQEAFERYVLPPEMRGRAEPGTPEFETIYGPVGYPTFANHNVVHAFRQNPGDVRVEHIGAKDVGPEGEGFKAVHKYRLAMPEGVFTVQVKLVAAEPRAGGKPQWHVELGKSPGITNPDWELFSQYGRLVMQVEEQAEKFGKDWMAHQTGGRDGQAFLYTRPTAEREKGESDLKAASLLAGGPLLAESIGAPGQPRPTIDALLKAGLFRRDAAGNPLPDTKAAKLRELWPEASITPVAAGRRALLGIPESGERPTFNLTPTEVTVEFPADMTHGPGHRRLTPVNIGVVCNDQALINALTTTKAQGATAKDDASVSLRDLPAPNWRIGWIRTDMESPNPLPRPGGPDAPGNGPGPGGGPLGGPGPKGPGS